MNDGDPTLTEAAPLEHEAAADAQYGLTVLASPDAEAVGRSFTLQRELVVGRVSRGPGTVAIRDALISREHTSFRTARGGGYEVADLSSRNGTHLNGEPVSCLPLRQGSVVRLGGTILLFDRVSSGEPSDPKMIGDSSAFQRVLTHVRRAAPGGASR